MAVGLSPPYYLFLQNCLHSALFVCTRLIFNALCSVCRCNTPTLLSALPTLCLHYLHFVYTACTTCTSFALSYIYKHIICCVGKECGYREGVKLVGVTENLLSLCPSNASLMLLGHVATRAGSVGSADKSVGSVGKSVGSADKSVGSVDKSVGSADKSAGISPLHTLRNALKIS